MSTDVARHVGRVLDGLRGHDLFRRNAFRVTGLPTDATPRQVRRAREESRNAYYVPPDLPDAPLPPSFDEAELRAGFEVLQDPVARLVHELLWVDDGADDELATAVVRLCRAVEGTSRDGVVEEGAWEDWRVGLTAWASGIGSTETSLRTRHRAEAADDPRLTVGAARELRRQLAQHVIEVAAGFAARQVRTSPDRAGRMVRMLHYAGFDAGEVPRALRSVARPLLAEVKEACEVVGADAGLPAAHALLAATREPLRLLEALLGSDALLDARRDDVALKVSDLVLTYGGDHVEEIRRGRGPVNEMIGLLESARALASASAQGQVDEGLGLFRVVRNKFGSRPATVRKAPGGSPSARLAPRTPAPALAGRLDDGGVWAWLLVLGPVPALLLGLGSAALDLHWFWLPALALVVAYLVARGRCGRRAAGGPWAVALVPALTALFTSTLGEATAVLAFVALLLAVLVATAKENR